MPNYRNETVTITGEVCADTPLAWHFFQAGDTEGDAVWLPKSQCEWDEEAREMEMPTWLAEKNGLG